MKVYIIYSTNLNKYICYDILYGWEWDALNCAYMFNNITDAKDILYKSKEFTDKGEERKFNGVYHAPILLAQACKIKPHKLYSEYPEVTEISGSDIIKIIEVEIGEVVYESVFTAKHQMMDISN